MNPNDSHPSSNRRGFTLVEFLVILGIVAVLTVLLFPVLASAKSPATNCDDFKKIGRLANAAAMYAADANDTYPCAGVPAQNFAWSPAVNPTVDAAGNPWMGWGLRVAPYEPNYQSFLSPLDPKVAQFSGPCASSGSMQLTNDYALNWMLGSDGSFGDSSNNNDPFAWSPDQSRQFIQPLAIAQVVSPSNTIAFLPSNAATPVGRTTGCLISTLQASDFANTIQPYTFTSTGANLGFTDGHAKFVVDQRMTPAFQGQSGPWTIYHLKSRQIWMEPTMPYSTMGYINQDGNGNLLGDL